MKRYQKAFGVSFTAIVAICFTSIYVISCFNAGEALSFGEFTNGLLGRVTNCGGNSAARTYCQNIALDAFVTGSDAGNDTFDYTKLSQLDQNEILALIDDSHTWTSDAKYLMRTGPIHTGHGTHELIVVCDTAYGNVPQPTFWNLHHSTMRHAAGYSDGRVGWLTTREFAQLNKSNFVELKLPPRPIPDNATNAVSFE
jgi:hypothetical protein